MQCVQGWTNYLDSDGKYKNVEGSEAALWLVEVIKATHLSRLIKNAGRSLMANRLFTRNLQSLKYVDSVTGIEHPNSIWVDLIVPALTQRLKVLAAQAEKANDESGLAEGFGPTAGTCARHPRRGFHKSRALLGLSPRANLCPMPCSCSAVLFRADACHVDDVTTLQSFPPCLSIKIIQKGRSGRKSVKTWSCLKWLPCLIGGIGRRGQWSKIPLSNQESARGH